ncbi:MAG: glycosyltransferase family 4 protein [bacterium]
MVNKFRIKFSGLLKSPVSWARVNREFLAALSKKKQAHLTIQPCRGFLWSEDFKLPSELEKITGRREKEDKHDIQLAFAYPPAIASYGFKKTLWNFSVYEASRLPKNWAEPLNRYCQKIIVPSHYNKRVYIKSGVREDKVIVIPYGYNPKFYRPETCGNNRKTEIITVATPHYRKGLDLLENCAGLLKKYPVNWRVHSPYEPGPQPEYWEDGTISKRLQKLGFKVTVGPLSEEEISRLYRKADLAVQPSRSEGFGLAILEAMASATPVVTSGYSGPLEFSGPGMFLVGGEIQPAKNCQYGLQNRRAKIFEPDRQQLKSIIETLLQKPEKLQHAGVQAHRTVKHLTWENAANLFLKKL